MASNFGNGTVYSIAKTMGTAAAFTSVTNAAEAVATMAAAPGFSVGAVGVVSTPSWAGVNGMIARVKTIVGNAVTLEKLDTTSTTQNPAGEGAGTFTPITAWDVITQVRKPEVSGGEPVKADTTFLADLRKSEVTVSETPTEIAFEVAEDRSLAWRPTVLAAMRSRAKVPLRQADLDGGLMYANATWHMQAIGERGSDAVNIHKVTASLASEPSFY